MLENFEIYSCLCPLDQQFLLRGATKKKALKRSIIGSQGDGYIYLIEKGMVKTFLDFPSSKIMFTGVVANGGSWNVQSLLPSNNCIEYAEVVDNEVEYIQLQKVVVQQLLERNLNFNICFQKLISACFDRFERRMTLALNHRDVNSRLRIFLIRFAQEFGRRVGDELLVDHQLSHSDFADLVLASRQSVTGAMNTLRENNIINYERGRLLIRNA